EVSIIQGADSTT
nr:Chain a, GLU-VAL-SER-ILE-ILE-GLN-GLY-ALA-ASP-SER-THR-THR [Homo sapiens]7D3D_b Chain b, GLU-VAL-SER-ILE-ILE-GLN-GLY-ALA-ASP-SER-THR-THR [Homo sapiens]